MHFSRMCVLRRTRVTPTYNGSAVSECEYQQVVLVHRPMFSECLIVFVCIILNSQCH